MGKNKHKRFVEMAEFKNVFQPLSKGFKVDDFKLKGKWNKKYFKNDNSIVLELGCGKGEYTVALAKQNINKNFIGVDIKGARIWRGAKTALEIELKNVAFLRTKIEFLTNFFDENEISEIWIPFPDPQPKKVKKRLISSLFLNLYQKTLKNNGLIHLKTDSFELHQYTLALLKKNKIQPIEVYSDVYSVNIETILTQVQTFYEKKFLEEGKKITYLSFRLSKNKVIEAPDSTNEGDYKY